MAWKTVTEDIDWTKGGVMRWNPQWVFSLFLCHCKNGLSRKSQEQKKKRPPKQMLVWWHQGLNCSTPATIHISHTGMWRLEQDLHYVFPHVHTTSLTGTWDWGMKYWVCVICAHIQMNFNTPVCTTHNKSTHQKLIVAHDYTKTII